MASPYSGIEQALPNNPSPMDEGPGTEIEVPNEEGMETEGEVTIEEDEEGGATVIFGRDIESLDISSLGFGDNIAEVLDDEQLSSISKELCTAIEEDDAGREEWKKAYEEGLTLLGLTYEERTEPFNGSTGVVHPLLNEAVTQFQAQAYKEMLPAGGPARTLVVGQVTPEKEQQAERVKSYMNYQITVEMEEYDPEYDQMLFYLGYGGSAFKKVYYDGELRRAVSPYVLPKDLIVPYSARDLGTAERVTHVLRISKNNLRKQQVSGFYRDVEIPTPTQTERDEIEEKTDKISGVEPSGEPEDYLIYECHCFLDIPGFEDKDEDGNPTGISLPYIVTVDATSGTILAIRRNFRENDPKKKKKQYFVHYKMLPGMGFYGFGLIHLLGNLSRSSTSVLRQLIDSGTLANIPAGFKAKGMRIQDAESPIQPGEWRDVDAPGGALRENLMPLPYKEPSATLMSLLGFCVTAGEKFIGSSDMGMGDSNQELPVGTTIALLERGSRVMSAVHKRMHYAQKQELRLLAEVFAEYMPPEYPYQVEGQKPTIKKQDFDGRVDIIPVSDPNIFSMTQRIALAQQQLTLAQTAPQMHNTYEAYRRMYTALGVTDINLILPPPPQPQPEGPAVENSRAMLVPNGAQSLRAFPEQDHVAHIDAHIAFIKTPLIQASPQVYGILLGHVFEHVSFAAMQTVRAQMQDLMRPQVDPVSGRMLPPIPPPAEMLQASAAKLEAAMINQIMASIAPPPADTANSAVLELQKRDLDIRQRALEAKEEESVLKLDLEERKLAAKERIDEERRQSNEDIAQLRANVSIERARLSNEGKGV
jgi:hypothetical protein